MKAVALISVGLSLGTFLPVAADVCTVPGTHSTVQSAVEDLNCSVINLADQTYSESVRMERSLSLIGPPQIAVIEGLFEAKGSGTIVSILNIEVQNGCQPSSLSVSDGARIESTSKLEVVRMGGGPCPALIIGSIFSDGFESGNTSVWSTTVP